MAGEFASAKADEESAPERARIMDTLRQLGVADKDLEIIDGHLPVIIKAHEMNRKAMELLGDPRVSAKLVADLIVKRMGREPIGSAPTGFKLQYGRSENQRYPGAGNNHPGNGKRR
jgi:hypothetical protein